MRRARRPLDPEAVRIANAGVAPQPGGRGLTMQPEDAALRKQWMDAYLAALNDDTQVTRDTTGDDICPEEVVATCSDSSQTVTTSLTVWVRYTPQPEPIAGATVTIDGPQASTARTDARGAARFDGIAPGLYAVNAEYDTDNALVEEAMRHRGSTDWGYRADRPPYGPDTNKCNLFVYEVANAAGFTVPKRERFSWSRMSDVWYPPLAGEWAGSGNVGSWRTVSSPKPGDSIAQAIDYSDATGHVGIVAYPEQIQSVQADVEEGQDNEAEVELHRRTISAGGTHVLYNDWGYRPKQLGKTRFKRYSP